MCQEYCEYNLLNWDGIGIGIDIYLNFRKLENIKIHVDATAVNLLRRKAHRTTGIRQVSDWETILRFASIFHNIQHIISASVAELVDTLSDWVIRRPFDLFVNEENYTPTVVPSILCPCEETRGYSAWWAEREKLAPIAYGNYHLRVKPSFSVLVPVYNPETKWLLECIDSVRSQKYPRWELILCDDGSKSEQLSAILNKTGATDSRIRIIILKNNCGISAATNRAARKAKGEYLVFLDHDDILDPHALQAFAVAINENMNTGRVDIIYADEDFILEGEQALRSPSFKPKYSPDLLLATNYMHHPIAIRKFLFNRLGGLRRSFDGSQDHDLLLRATEICEQIIHIPDILYHMRVHSGSLASGPQAKPEAHGRDLLLIQETLKRRRIDGEVFQSTYGHPGQNVIKRKLSQPISISIIIVSEGTAEADNPECVWGDHQCLSAEPDLSIPEQVNKMAGEAEGDILIIAECAVRPKSGWEEALVPHILRHDIGLVTGKLTFHDDMLFSCGLVLGMGGASGRWHYKWPSKQPGLAGWLAIDHEVAAVPWQFMGIRKKLFLESGGFNTLYQYNGFSEDLALRLTIQRKLRHLAIPGAEACFIERYLPNTNVWNENDRDLLWSSWKEYLRRGDPFLNPNYSLSHEDVKITDTPTIAIQAHWWPSVLRR